VNLEVTAALGYQVCNREPIWINQGFQFCYLSEKTGLPCIPTFTATNGGTGLSMSVIGAQALTPVVTLNLAKVG
jgi:hypothetical protein